MANSDKSTKSMVGTLSLVLVVLVVLTSVAVSFAVGYGLGREWGWVALAAFLVVYCVVIGSTIRKMAREERDDG